MSYTHLREVLRRIGVSSVTVVPEQEKPDGRFPTAPYPNPEIREAFGCALKLAEREEPDLLLATDPDCDRVGIAVRNGGDYTQMCIRDRVRRFLTLGQRIVKKRRTWAGREDRAALPSTISASVKAAACSGKA